MKYKASIRVTGNNVSASGDTHDVYVLERSVEADGLGELFDELVELSYEMYYKIDSWIMDHPGRARAWSVMMSYPKDSMSLIAKTNTRSGGAVFPLREIIMRAISIRDSELRKIIRVLNVNPKTGITYEPEAEHEIHEILSKDIPLEKWRDYGIRGIDTYKPHKMNHYSTYNNRCDDYIDMID